MTIGCVPEPCGWLAGWLGASHLEVPLREALSVSSAFGTTVNIPDVGFARNELAILPEFKETISGVRVVEVIRPTRAQISIVGSQTSGGTVLEGGVIQIRVLDYDRSNPFVVFSGPERPIQ